MDGTTQEVTIKWRDALLAMQRHMLSAEYDPAVDLQLEPEIAQDLREQIFDDYSNSMLFYLADSFLRDGQCVLLVDFSSDGSQFGDGRQEFWSVTVTPGCYRKGRRQMLDCKILVGQLPKVLGADEKAHMYQHAIRLIFRSMNAAGRHGVRMYYRGARGCVFSPFAPCGECSGMQAQTALSLHSRCFRCCTLSRSTTPSTASLQASSRGTDRIVNVQGA
jgi:hypothetical protein